MAISIQYLRAYIRNEYLIKTLQLSYAPKELTSAVFSPMPTLAHTSLLASRAFSATRILRQKCVERRKGLEIRLAQALPAGTRRGIPVLRGVVGGRVVGRRYTSRRGRDPRRGS